jgi:dTDP-4-dehydrorhamnose reductase
MRVLLTGASGSLGGYLLRELSARQIETVAWSGANKSALFEMEIDLVDLANPNEVARAFAAARPDVVIHAAAVASIADCFRDPLRAQHVNVQGSALLADLAAKTGARMVLTSTDLVFGGLRGCYREDDVPMPLSVYGRTKLAAEKFVLTRPRNTVVRLSLLFGPSLTGRQSFFDTKIAALRAGKSVQVFVDEWRTPLSLASAARGLLAVAPSDYTGLLHMGGPERLSRFEMGRRLAEFLQVDPSALVAATRDSMASGEPRPRDLSLDSGRWTESFPDHHSLGFADALGEMMQA